MKTGVFINHTSPFLVLSPSSSPSLSSVSASAALGGWEDVWGSKGVKGSSDLCWVIVAPEINTCTHL